MTLFAGSSRDRPEQFRTRHTHTDVRLALGWGSVAIAAATGYYSWKREFEETRPLVLIGVVLYFVLAALQTVYAYWIEGKTIFVGKRRTLVHRIEVERITINSETKPAPTHSESPSYSLAISYIRSTGKSKNKTILWKSSVTVEKKYTDIFDVEGTLDEGALIAWLAESSASVIEDKSTTSATADAKS